MSRRHGFFASPSRVAERVSVLAVLVTLWGLLLAPAPAQAAIAGDRLLGHRCHTYDAAVTNEDTVAALVDVSQVAGAWCEIDIWRLADGTMIVWHDATWGRVADHATLPPGIDPTDLVADATWQQVSQIRTKGGQPAAKFASMVDASAQFHVPLVAEIRNSITNPGYWVSHAADVGADVRYYQAATATCATGQVDLMRRAGATIGIKTSAHAQCHLTSSLAQSKGASFITDDPQKITTAYTSDMRAHGIEVYARGATKFNAQSLLAMGAARLLVNRPGDSVNW